MCGFCGIAKPDGARIENAVLRRMAAPLQRRGPDQEGFFSEAGIGLAHKRLKIIDLEGGVQPMTDSSGRYTIAYNGEIYNFLDLKKDLESLGIAFKTHSDTEVLLEWLARFGIRFIERLAGMFAFSLWDSREKTLWLVRDRLGVKPLYWSPTRSGGLVFGSELSSVMASGEVPFQISPKSTAFFLGISYLPGENSIVENVLHKGSIPPQAEGKYRKTVVETTCRKNSPRRGFETPEIRFRRTGSGMAMRTLARVGGKHFFRGFFETLGRQ